MTTWITDDNGNRASVEYWGSEAAARASLETLQNCRDCTDCTDCTHCTNCRYCQSCTNCRYCRNCQSCTNCRYCRNCQSCTNCRYCDLTRPHVPVPVSDPRGYTWLAICEPDGIHIRAGCRDFTPVEAREHWTSPDYDGPETVAQTAGDGIAWAVEYLTDKGA